MLERYAAGRADEENEMLSEVMLRVMLDERERELQEHMRVQGLLGGRRGAARRIYISPRPRTRAATSRGEAR